MTFYKVDTLHLLNIISMSLSMPVCLYVWVNNFPFSLQFILYFILNHWAFFHYDNGLFSIKSCSILSKRKFYRCNIETIVFLSLNFVSIYLCVLAHFYMIGVHYKNCVKLYFVFVAFIFENSRVETNKNEGYFYRMICD